jgi:hypothetical protein
MKTTTVPAQITTVEDKIAGNLSMSQLTLMAAPVLLSGLLYAVSPPFMRFTSIKMTIGVLLFVIFYTLAMRVRDKILLTWIIVITRYNIRPRYYLYNKNDSYLRKPEQVDYLINLEANKEAENVQEIVSSIPQLAIHDRARLELALSDPRSKLLFIAKRKGGLDVHITEIK